jgi:hypothetical protein
MLGCRNNTVSFRLYYGKQEWKGCPDKGISMDRFVYSEENGSYICPAGKSLLYSSYNSRRRNGETKDKLYWTVCNVCSACPFNSTGT